jgi:hypothetical protein
MDEVYKTIRLIPVHHRQNPTKMIFCINVLNTKFDSQYYISCLFINILVTLYTVNYLYYTL